MYLYTWTISKGIHQICEDPGCSLEDLPDMIDNRDGGESASENSVRLDNDDDDDVQDLHYQKRCNI